MVSENSRYGKLAPWEWAVEPVRGCNLQCGHCATALWKRGDIHFMDQDVWVNIFTLINQAAPRSRVDLNFAGEPSLHPRLIEFIKIAREIAPEVQIQIITNGTMLANNRLNYRDLFEAGLNVVYVDMYAPKEDHIKLAEESGIRWYEYLNQPPKAPSPWAYHSPDFKLIVLMQPPIRWPKKRYSMGRLGTFYNHLNWEAAKEFNMFPVEKPIARGCAQPFKIAPIDNSGNYLLCCQDFFGETNNLFGNVKDGLPAFEDYWFGKIMQEHRKHLRIKDRAWSPYCSRCNITFSMSDFQMWKDNSLQYYWKDQDWQPL